MLFQGLSDDIVRHIYTYDNTYKDMYKTIVMQKFENEECRALKTFLQGHIGFPMMMFDEWLSIRVFHFERETYYHVEYPTTRMLFHVTHMERLRRALPTPPDDDTVTKNTYDALPFGFLRRFMDSTLYFFERVTQTLANAMEFQTVGTCMFHAQEYQDLLHILEAHGKYEEHIHEYLFRRLVWIKSERLYDDDQSINYDYCNYADNRYLFMWYEHLKMEN